jgi:deferrochelatase/peroxidase EfeB
MGRAAMSDHAFINVVIPFDPDRSGAVDKVLRSLTDPRIGNRPAKHIQDALAGAERLHFVSITAVDPKCPAERDDPDPPTGKSHLVIELSADGGIAEALAMLAQQIGSELSDVLTAAGLAHDRGTLAEYLLRHHCRIGATWGADALGQVFTGSPGMSVRRIWREKDLAKRITELIDKEQKEGVPWHGLSARGRLEHLRDCLWEEGQWKWAFVPEPAPCLAGDPRNRWDPEESISNPQARKVVLSIANTFLQPLYLPLALTAALVYFFTASVCAVLWLLLGTVVALAALGPMAYAWLRRLEKTDPVEDLTPPASQVETLLNVENFCAQNHLASVSRLKPEWLRRVTLLVALIAVGSGRFVGPPGFLGKNGVIHFARWMRLPGTDQLLFWSNYDNTWASYVGDFIADAPSGVSAIWSNCVGFPRTRGLRGDGAQDRDRLVRWARRQQHPTTFWYSAYPDLTAERIRINAAIRQGLAAAESDADVRDWFALSFGSRPRPADALQATQIPTLVFGGLKGLRHAECHVVTFAAGEGFREWLTGVAEAATYGEAQPGQERAAVVALSATGLTKLGVPGEALATFPVAFQQGMWLASRARALGDEDDNAPGKWEWGSPESDALLLLYGSEAKDLEALRKELVGKPEASRQIRTHVVPLTPLDGSSKLQKEPFGFADGVSQPVIRGTPRSRTHPSAHDLVAPGEIVLGYPDILGRIPPSPSVAARDDPRRLLPDAAVPLAPPRRHPPEFSRYDGSGRRDLGANGTFLVVRQLEQHVTEFEDWLDETLEDIRHGRIPVTAASDGKSAALGWGVAAQDEERSGPSPRPRPRKEDLGVKWTDDRVRENIKEIIAAKLMGRWKDGTSLVRYPQAPGAGRPDNGFLLGAEDPRALACPLGAHIRRANPRDTRFPGSSEEIAITNRHRILRVGRVYEKDGSPRGLLFMCLNADIERQFEFIQKTWLLNPNIHGLEDEVDPLIGRKPRTFTLPTSSGVVRLKIDAPFVTVRGGGYFFLPGRTALQYLASLGRG